MDIRSKKGQSKGVAIGVALIAALVGLQLIAVAATQVSSYMTSERVLLGHARDIMEDVARQTVSHATDFLAPAETAADLTQRLAHHDVVRSSSARDLERYFYEQLRSSPQFAGIYYGTTDGTFYYVSKDTTHEGSSYRTKLITWQDGQRKVELIWRDENFSLLERYFDPEDDYDPRTRPWFIRSLEKGETVWTDPYIFFTSLEPGITVASPVKNDVAKIEGIVGVDIEIDEISTFLAGLKIGVHGKAFILNRNGDVVAYPELEKIKKVRLGEVGGLRFTRIDELDVPDSLAAFQSLEMPSGELNLAEPKITTFELDGERHHAVFTPMLDQRWPWVVAIHLPENDFLGDIKDNRLINIQIAIGIALLGCLLGYLIARSVARPIKKIGDTALTISEGDYSATPQGNSVFSELYATAEAFQHMLSRLRERETENQELTSELRNANESLESRVKDRTEALRVVIGQHQESVTALRKARDSAEAANLAKSEFLSSMSHEAAHTAKRSHRFCPSASGPQCSGRKRNGHGAAWLYYR